MTRRFTRGETRWIIKAINGDIENRERFLEYCVKGPFTLIVIPGLTRNPVFSIWIPAPRLRGDKFTPAKAGAGITASELK